MLRAITAFVAFMAFIAFVDDAQACPAGYGACGAHCNSYASDVACNLRNGALGAYNGQLSAKTEVVAGGALNFTIWGIDDHNNKFCCPSFPVVSAGVRRYLQVTGSQRTDTIDLCPGGAFVDTDTVVSGWDGDDYINGSCSTSYGDVLVGDNGTDHIYGNDGDDELQGTDGKDLLDGGAGDDYLYANSAVDHTTTDDGEQLYGGTGNDELYGANGDDKMDGGDGTDLVEGYEGDDLLCGYNGYADELYGDDGNDQLWSDNIGDDTNDAGGDFDTCHVDPAELNISCETLINTMPYSTCPPFGAL